MNLRRLWILSALIGGCLAAYSQPKTAQYHKGWPSREGAIDIRSGFVHPPKGYGNVPFYWWSGDHLDLERLSWQLDLLADSSTDGLCVSYNHTHPKVDTLINAQGYGGYGRVSSGDPFVLSPEWMKLWAEFSERCADYGIGLGLDDYVVASPGNGAVVDEVLADPGIRNHQGRLRKGRFPKGADLPGNVLRTDAADDSLDVYYTVPSPELHPDYGRLMVEKYFQPFEDAMGPKGRDGMNYFFQDELIYNLNLLSWCDGMRDIFFEKKGYDLLPHLDALFATKDEEIGPEEARVRLDYAEVLTVLAEERYFKPIYEWHAERGLIYGCDNLGRGIRPLQYLDYFRATSWFTAPGNDAPARGSSFRQTKVSSSVAHLYGRPRTWLEAFHSMGWDANGKVLTRQLDHHLIAGGNLLCLHGLYYTTHGGWWEWAPPSFHFRMPYWPHMKAWLRYAERMCFVLSQGTHVCDVAFLYPTETMQAFPQSRPDLMFKTALHLSDHGLDYDFIDYQSLRKAEIRNGALAIGDETYRVLVLAGIKAMHPETSARIREFEKAGGKVLVVGDDDASGALVSRIHSLLTPDFSTSSGEGKVLHRRVGKDEVYMVMDVHPGDTMTFRADGKVECWDAMHGTRKPVPVLGREGGRTRLVFDGAEGNSMLLVISPGKPKMAGKEKGAPVRRMEVPVEGEWAVEIVPTMDNRWGDFRLPKSDGKIGVEAREFRCRPTDGPSEPFESIYGYAPYMRTLDIPSDTDKEAVREILSKAVGWKPYLFSWQYGVFDSPGSQGYHGLKEKPDDCFLILDKGCHQVFQADLAVPSDGNYLVVKRGKEPDMLFLDGEPLAGTVTWIDKGNHCLSIVYLNTRKTGYSLEKMRGHTMDRRERGMVMLYPEGSRGPVPRGMHDSIVASGWYGTDFVPFVHGGSSGWIMTFETAPGTVAMHFETAGTIEEMTVDGKAVPFRETGQGLTPGGHPVRRYVADHLPLNPGVSAVSMRVLPDRDAPGAAFFTEPVRMDCSGGRMEPGDWSFAGAMKFYSGGVRYSKVIRLDEKGRKVWLDLGDVDATCEVSVNGKKVDVLLRPPYRLDLTKVARKGKNDVEVLVYSSLSNHYQTIPSPYKGTPRAGLLGPVKIVVEK